MKKTATAFLAVMALLLALATAACSNSSSGGGSGPTYGGGSAGDGNVTATEAELAVITEMNYARTKPQEYVSQRLQPLVSSSSGTYLTALNECISQMNAMSPLRELAFGQGLYKAAQEWVAEQGKGSSTGHASNWDALLFCQNGF